MEMTIEKNKNIKENKKEKEMEKKKKMETAIKKVVGTAIKNMNQKYLNEFKKEIKKLKEKIEWRMENEKWIKADKERENKINDLFAEIDETFANTFHLNTDDSITIYPYSAFIRAENYITGECKYNEMDDFLEFVEENKENLTLTFETMCGDIESN